MSRFTKTLLRRIYLSKDETYFFAYHPDRSHSYQDTKPLPKVARDESILKETSRDMITKSPNLEQVQSLTYTHARYWRQTPGLDRRERFREHENDNVDRSGLTS